MDTRRRTLDIEAPIGPRRFDDLAGMLQGMGYQARQSGGGMAGQRPGGRDMTMTIRTADPLDPSAASSLQDAVTDWVRRGTQRGGRFRRWRRRAPRPITVVIMGPNGEVLSRGVIERG